MMIRSNDYGLCFLFNKVINNRDLCFYVAIGFWSSPDDFNWKFILCSRDAFMNFLPKFMLVSFGMTPIRVH